MNSERKSNESKFYKMKLSVMMLLALLIQISSYRQIDQFHIEISQK